MTQEALAKRCGIVRQTVIAIEKGSFNPSVKLALKICRVPGTTIEEVFLLEEEDLA